MWLDGNALRVAGLVRIRTRGEIVAGFVRIQFDVVFSELLRACLYPQLFTLPSRHIVYQGGSYEACDTHATGFAIRARRRVFVLRNLRALPVRGKIL